MADSKALALVPALFRRTTQESLENLVKPLLSGARVTLSLCGSQFSLML